MRGRYKFGNQPAVALWNLVRLANAFYPAVGDVEPLQEVMQEYSAVMEQEMEKMNRDKLGLATWKGEEDASLCTSLTDIMAKHETDMTILYRK